MSLRRPLCASGRAHRRRRREPCTHAQEGHAADEARCDVLGRAPDPSRDQMWCSSAPGDTRSIIGDLLASSPAGTAASSILRIQSVRRSRCRASTARSPRRKCDSRHRPVVRRTCCCGRSQMSGRLTYAWFVTEPKEFLSQLRHRTDASSSRKSAPSSTPSPLERERGPVVLGLGRSGLSGIGRRHGLHRDRGVAPRPWASSPVPTGASESLWRINLTRPGLGLGGSGRYRWHLLAGRADGPDRSRETTCPRGPASIRLVRADAAVNRCARGNRACRRPVVGLSSPAIRRTGLRHLIVQVQVNRLGASAHGIELESMMPRGGNPSPPTTGRGRCEAWEEDEAAGEAGTRSVSH